MSGLEMESTVRVAVNVRPFLSHELRSKDVLTITAGEPRVQIGSHAFTFDSVFGNDGLPPSKIYDVCVAPLVEGLFHGYNATVLAYGQVGSGKTYMMGTNYSRDDRQVGIIPKVMDAIFSKVESTRNSREFLIRVSFVEIFKEDVFDLLDSNPSLRKPGDLGVVKQPIFSRTPIQIRETFSGGITLAGVIEAEVRTKEDVASLLHGSVARATASTNMNSQSSRSHAIITISLEQKGISSSSTNDGVVDDILRAKLHLVDLAGSERAKRTGADGVRLREGIHVNKGLVALGNVISALGDEKKRKEGGHVPYRDSKLTRLLQDSLGGNSKTVMIACVSPADTNAGETLNTLKYANRARNIQNKAIINRDPTALQLQRMRSEIKQLQAELSFFRGGNPTTFEELQTLKHKVSLLEANNTELQRELQERQISFDHLAQCAIDTQVERDGLLKKIESAHNGKPWSEIESITNEGFDLLKNYISKIQELEGILFQLQSSKPSKRRSPVTCLLVDGDKLQSKRSCDIDSDIRDSGISGDKVEAKEIEHSSLQEKLDRELKELNRKLEKKEAEVKRFASGDTSVLKTHYEKKVEELELEKRVLQREIEELRNNLASVSSTSDDNAHNLKKEYLQKLNSLQAQVVGDKRLGVCSCSRKSECRTRKCECHTAGGKCGNSCSCKPVKCANRGAPSPKDEVTTTTSSRTSGEESIHGLASQGDMLLQSSLSANLVSKDDGVVAKRQPLSDIGNSNTQAKVNATNPNGRKRRMNPIIPVVPAAPPTAEANNGEASINQKVESEVAAAKKEDASKGIT